MRSQVATQRIRSLERKLSRFDEREVAAIGRRVQASICADSPVDGYEQALIVTLKVLSSHKRTEKAQALRLPVPTTAWIHSTLGHLLMFEPEAA